MSRISEVGQRSCKSIGIDYAFITAKMYNNRISVERSRAISLIIDPGDEIDRVRLFAGQPRVTRGIASSSGPFDPDIGRKFLAHFITQACSQFKAGEARPNAQGRHILQGEVQFDARLENELLGDALIVAAFDAGPDIASPSTPTTAYVRDGLGAMSWRSPMWAFQNGEMARE